MTTTQNPWRSVKNDPPQQCHCPVVFGKWNNIGKWEEWIGYLHDCTLKATHWRSIKADPPSRELTQRERDEEAWDEWLRRTPDFITRQVWHAALAWERDAVVDELVEAYRAFSDAPLDTRTNAMFFRDFFRARREGGVKS
jgi:hypothetical protein